ncbi:MAG: Vanadium chloroperoxidase N-terminal domain, partial [Acetobacteraceae bacterium]|nr:Vanadium chloroperoxidase N-terminal domain [Acetobacteraceae bacterium]
MPRHLTARTVPGASRTAVGGLLIAAAILAGLGGAQPARADNQVIGWNQEFLNLTQQTSGNLVAGPPEVAREIAIIGNAMSDAVTAATGGNSFYAYAGGVVAGADANVAAAAAAYTALSSIYNNAAWQSPISTITGNLTPNVSNVNLVNNVVLPQLNTFLTADLASLGLTSPGSCSGSGTSLCLGFNLGVAAANAV